jgi:hypothetical protein
MTSIQEQLKALKTQETALKAQLKKAQKKPKEELKIIEDFKKYVVYYNSRPVFSQILRYVNELNYNDDAKGLEAFENWFLVYNSNQDTKYQRINQICDLIDGAFPNIYPKLRKNLLEELANMYDDEEEEN